MHDANLDHDAISQLLVEQFVRQRLPVIIRLREKVLDGTCLSDAELDLMEQTLDRARGFMPGSNAFPEYDDLFAKCINLYSEIADCALRNEQRV